MNVSWCVVNFSRAVKKNIHDHFEIQSASEGQFRQAGDKEDRQNAFGCMLPFRMIRYARNCRAPVGVHARARGRVVCTVRDAPRAWPSSIHESIPIYIYTMATHIAMKRRLKIARFQYTFDFRCYKKSEKSKKNIDIFSPLARSLPLLCVFIVPNNFGDHFRVAIPKSDIW